MADRSWPNNLKEFREKHSYSQSDIAVELNVAQTTVAAIEVGVLSGRKYMDAIGRIIGETPDRIFPYYHYVTAAEAVRDYGVSPKQLLSASANGSVRTIFGSKSTLFHKDDLQDSSLKKKSGLTLYEAAVQCLQSKNGSGATSLEIVELLGPFSSEDEKKRKRSSLQSVLSRSDDFVSSKNGGKFVWHLSRSANTE